MEFTGTLYCRGDGLILLPIGTYTIISDNILDKIMSTVSGCI